MFKKWSNARDVYRLELHMHGAALLQAVRVVTQIGGCSWAKNRADADTDARAGARRSAQSCRMRRRMEIFTASLGPIVDGRSAAAWPCAAMRQPYGYEHFHCQPYWSTMPQSTTRGLRRDEVGAACCRRHCIHLAGEPCPHRTICVPSAHARGLPVSPSPPPSPCPSRTTRTFPGSLSSTSSMPGSQYRVLSNAVRRHISAAIPQSHP